MVGDSAAENNPCGLMTPWSEFPRGIARTPGLGALAMTVRPPLVSAPATSGYLNRSFFSCTSEPMMITLAVMAIGNF